MAMQYRQVCIPSVSAVSCPARNTFVRPSLRSVRVLRGRERCLGGSGAQRESGRPRLHCAVGVAVRPPAVERASPSVPDESPDLQQSIRALSSLVSRLGAVDDWDSKLEVLRRDGRVQRFTDSSREARLAMSEALHLSPQHACMILSLPAMGQDHVLLVHPPGGLAGLRAALQRLAEALVQVDDFFASLGGLPWYQLRCLRFIADAAEQDSPTPPASPSGHTNGHTNGYTSGHSNGCTNGHINGHTNGHSNGNGYSSERPTGITNGHRTASNGRSNGHMSNQTNGHSNGHTSNQTNGHSNGHTNGHATGYASSPGLEGMPIDISGVVDRIHEVPGSSGGVNGHKLNGHGVNGAKAPNGHINGQSISDSRHSHSDSTGSSLEQTDNYAPQFHMPTGIDLENDAEAARRAAAHGLQALPYMAEIYPIGGAGDRLGLIDEETGESVPTAMLPYCGRTLLEGLLRDLQAREALHWRLTGRQVVTPLALMTSDAKGNHRRITALLESSGWFGRCPDSFRLFRQPMVPVVGAEAGRWPLAGALAPMMKPGGHGAIWKLMADQGVFSWLARHRREGALVRQISNPLAGTDSTLLALSGAGYMGGKLFGFASCPRAVGAAEGMNVLAERRVKVPHSEGGGWGYEYGITNIEYTEFKRLGISDEAQSEGSALSVFPANTNVLYLGLKAAEAAVRADAAAGGGAALPGLIFNGSKTVVEPDLLRGGAPAQVPAGRLECTMQNLADTLVQRFPSRLAEGRRGDLHTFAVFNSRRKVTSSAKRRRREGSLALAQTPDGSFRDLMANARDLLLNHCGFSSVPEVGEVEEYLASGPGFIFLFHPALGPLWDVIGQKVRGGSLAARSEVVLEVAAAHVEGLHVDGSLLVTATAPLGHMQAAALDATAPPRARPPPLCAPTSFDSLEGLFFDDSWALKEARSEYLTTSPPGAGGDTDSAATGGGGGRLVFSNRCGRLRLSNVAVVNAGVAWGVADNVFWRHQVARRESARITLHGNAEFEAWDVVLSGDCCFSVPDGHRMVVTSGADGRPAVSVEALPGGRATWDYTYDMAADGTIALSMRTQPAASAPGRVPQPHLGDARSTAAPPPTQPAINGSGRAASTTICPSASAESDPSWFSSQL